MPYAEPALSLSPSTAVTLAGDITMTVTPKDGTRDFPEGCVLVINGLEGLVPTAATTTRKQLVVVVPNTARAVGTYMVQVRYADGRITAPTALTITA